MTDRRHPIKAETIPDENFLKYTKKPVTIDAVQIHEPFVVETMENKRGEKLHGSPEDYLIKGVKGELYPCDVDVFEETYRPEYPKVQMRTFHLQRNDDESGTSGEGIVAEGVEFQDGTVVLHWFNEDNVNTETTSDGLSVKPGPDGAEDTIEVHGHGGKTEIVWHD